MVRCLLVTILLHFGVGNLLGQDTLKLIDPSFEKLEAKIHKTPDLGAWYNCEQPPPRFCVHSSATDFFHVKKYPTAGENFAMLIAREDSTRTILQARPTVGFKKNSYYKLSFDLCQSTNLVSITYSSHKLVKFDTPAVLELWRSASSCAKGELIISTDIIDHPQWKKYTLYIETGDDNLKYLTIAANYSPRFKAPYNGNILLDNISAIIEIDSVTYVKGAENMQIEKVERTIFSKNDAFKFVRDTQYIKALKENKLVRFSVLSDIDLISKISEQSTEGKDVFGLENADIKWKNKIPRLLTILHGLQLYESEAYLKKMYNDFEKLETKEVTERNSYYEKRKFESLLRKERFLKQVDWYINLNKTYIEEEVKVL